MVDLSLFVPCFPAFFDLQISLGQKRLVMLHLKVSLLFQNCLSKWITRTINKVASKSVLNSLNIGRKTLSTKNDAFLT